MLGVKASHADRRYPDRALEFLTDPWEYRFYRGTGGLRAQLMVQISASPQRVTLAQPDRWRLVSPSMARYGKSGRRSMSEIEKPATPVS